MNLFKTIAVFSLMAAASLFADKKDHHHHVDKGNPVVKPARKFIADDNLKKRMNIVLATMKELHQKEEKGLTKEQAAVIGSKIEATVQDIFKNCKLAPDADAAIHPILADLLEGSALLKKGKAKAGHEKIHHALLEYEDNFEHKGWQHDRKK